MNQLFNAPTAKVQQQLDDIGRSLTPTQRKFADIMAIGNVRSRADAAKQAGSLAKTPSAVACKWMDNPVILNYIQHAISSRLTDMTATAISTMDHLIRNADEDKVRFMAAKDTLDRVGLKAPDRKQVHHSGGVSINIDLS
jgi:phage terminase small subunit